MSTGCGYNNTTDQYNNISCLPDPSTPLSMNVLLSTVLIILQVVLVLFILVGNTLILLAIKQTHSLRSVSFYFIANMAAADILLGFALALRLVLLLTASLNTASCVAIIILATMTGLASATAILFMCMESYLAVRHIIIFRTALTQRVALVLICSSWLLWTLFSSSMLLAPHTDSIPGSQCTYAHPYFNKWFILAVGIALVLIMMAVFTLQGLTCMHLHKHYRGMLQGIHQGRAATEQQRLLNRVHGMTQLIALILIAFLFTWGPYVGALMVHTLCSSCTVTGQHFVYLTLIITLNSVGNVMLYVLKSKDFRNAFVKLLPCFGCHKRVHSITGTSVPPTAMPES